jgi:serine/threonine protein kinase
MDDFSILKVLGKGAFGKVMLVKKKDDKNNNLYALKTLRKAEIVKRGQVEHTKTERVVLERINCPFLVHLVYAFQTTEKLYMVLEYSGGGELFFWIKKQHRFSESRARLYAAEVLLAVAAMHKENIIHRDLKPENILCVPPPPSLLSSLHFPTLTLTLTPFSRLSQSRRRGPRQADRLWASQGRHHGRGRRGRHAHLLRHARVRGS